MFELVSKLRRPRRLYSLSFTNCYFEYVLTVPFTHLKLTQSSKLALSQQRTFELLSVSMSDDHYFSDDVLPKLLICLIGISSVVVVVIIYSCLTVGNILSMLGMGCGGVNSTRARVSRGVSLRLGSQDQIQSSFGHSMTELIPAHKYQKGAGLIMEADVVCAICLLEFEEGEELRTLPECMHSFHVLCIDMWFCSHLNCPICRAHTTPSPSLHIPIR